MIWGDRTFCAAKCVNSLCRDNKIHTAKAPEGALFSWADFSKDCVAYEATDNGFVVRLPIEVLAAKANVAAGMNWETGEAFHELSFQVVNRLWELKGRSLTQAQREEIEAVMERLRLRKSGLPWVEDKGL
jgi:hypothetical protein